jgi:hypothetical protein
MTDKQKAKQWKAMAIRLAKDLNRFSVDCGEVHHHPTEYHNSGEPCPVCEKIHKTISDFDNLLSNVQGSRTPDGGDR